MFKSSTARIWRRLCPIVLSLSLFTVPAGTATASDAAIMVQSPFARASATPVAKAGAAYFTVMNHGPADRLVGVSASISKRAMLHSTEEKDGILKMVHRMHVDIPRHGSVSFEPGGLHVMLMGLKQPLKEGAQFPLTLSFEKAGAIEVMVPVGGVAAKGAGGHGDHSGHGQTD